MAMPMGAGETGVRLTVFVASLRMLTRVSPVGVPATSFRGRKEGEGRILNEPGPAGKKPLTCWLATGPVALGLVTIIAGFCAAANCGTVMSMAVAFPVETIGSSVPTRTSAPAAKPVPVMCTGMAASFVAKAGLMVPMVGAPAGALR